MIWMAVILLAAACFAAFAFIFNVPKPAWSATAAMLALGLAGYASQASPGLPSAPRSSTAPIEEEGWRIVDLRKELIGETGRSGSNFVLTADAFMRKGQYANAANLLRGAVKQNPGDAEAWLALANALAFQADGVLTPAAMLAYRRADEAAPGSAGPPYFIGLSLIRQGRLIEGREIWAEQLESMPEDAPGRSVLAQRLGRLDELLRRIAEMPAESAR